jgi:hypothetical protein
MNKLEKRVGELERENVQAGQAGDGCMIVYDVRTGEPLKVMPGGAAVFWMPYNGRDKLSSGGAIGSLGMFRVEED